MVRDRRSKLNDVGSFTHSIVMWLRNTSYVSLGAKYGAHPPASTRRSNVVFKWFLFVAATMQTIHTLYLDSFCALNVS